MTVIEIKVPDIGDYSKVPVIEVLVTVGDHVVKTKDPHTRIRQSHLGSAIDE